MSEKILVFDVGTTGARTIIFDINGKEISRAYEEYQLAKQPAGIFEQDPAMWWNAVKKTCNEAVKKVNVDDIIGVSGAFFRATITLMDKNNEVLHPALTWLDEREISNAKVMTEEEGFRRLLPKLNWFKREKPDLFEKATKIIQPDTYIYLKLCGEFVTDPSLGIFGTLNTETLKWDENLAEVNGIPTDLWPELRNPGDVIGELSSKTASILGLKSNIPVILGGADQQCAALGLGAINIGQAKVTTGTGTFVQLVMDSPKKQVGDIPIFSLPHVIKNKWVIEGTVPGTGAALQWFKDNFSQLQIKEAEAQNRNIYDLLSTEAESIPIGSEGLLFIPLYMFRKGTIHGLSLNHTRGHMIRAIMESAALSAGMYLQLIEAMAGAKATELMADGGAMNSDFWAQMFADVIGKSIKIPETKDGAAMGAAILGFLGCKKYQNYEEAVEKMVRFVDTKNTDKKSFRTYKKLARIYMPALLEIYNKKRITKNL